MRIRALMCACLLASAPATAQVYKWVDANGVTHYGEKPPATGKSSEVRLRDSTGGSGGAAAPAAGAPSYKERELEFRKRQAQRERDETKLAEERGKRDRECKQANLDLADLRATRKIYDLNERGERVWLSDSQRDAEIAKREADYNRRCG